MARARRNSWRRDKAILDRMTKVAEMKLAGLTDAHIALKLDVTTKTVQRDRQRLVELRQDKAIAATDKHIESLETLKAKLMEQLNRTNSSSVNVGALFRELRQIEMEIARLDGSLNQKIELSQEGPWEFTFDLGRDPAPSAARDNPSHTDGDHPE
jgi:hypothetical protein